MVSEMIPFFVTYICMYTTLVPLRAPDVKWAKQPIQHHKNPIFLALEKHQIGVNGS